jgi:uncharacterized protein YoxC
MSGRLLQAKKARLSGAGGFMFVEVDIIALSVLAVVILFVAILLPMIWQLKKTGREADALGRDLRRELMPALRDFREITARINRASVNIEKGSGHAENLFQSLNEIALSVRQISHSFRLDRCNLAGNTACLIMGLRAAIRVFSKETQD